MIFLNETAILTDEIIDSWVSKSAEHYEMQAGKRANSTTKLRLTIEELLLKFRKCYGTKTPCTLIGRKRLGKITFELRQKGKRRDPIAHEEGVQLSFDILARLGVEPKYYYSRRTRINSVTVPAEMKPSKNRGLILILSAVALAALLALGLKAFAPDFAQLIYNSFTGSVFKKLIAVLAALATPLVFLAVIDGIVGIGDISSFGKLGGKVLKFMGFTYLIAGAALAACTAIAYPMQSSEASGQDGVFSQLLQLVLDIIPDNLLQPFTVDNDLQVIAIAIFVGIVMLVLGKQLHYIPLVVKEASALVNKMMAFVCELLPIIVFLGVFNLLISSNVSDFVSIYKVLVFFLVGSVVVIAVSTFRAWRASKAPLGVIIRKTLPTLLINLATSSQVAALPENLNCCKNKFGIDSKLVDFAVPLGVVVFMPCGAIFLGLTGASLADISGISLDFTAVVTIVVVSIVLAIAAPPIPGSAFAVLPILFTALSIPESVYPLAVVLGTVLGYLLPAVNGYLLQMEMLCVAAKSGKIDFDVARSRETI